jgi:hypothetical protein
MKAPVASLLCICIHKQGSRYSTEVAPERYPIPTGLCSQLQWNDFQYSLTENPDHDMQTMEALNDNNIISHFNGV